MDGENKNISEEEYSLTDYRNPKYRGNIPKDYQKEAVDSISLFNKADFIAHIKSANKKRREELKRKHPSSIRSQMQLNSMMTEKEQTELAIKLSLKECQDN